jgi:hypothetical protein
MDFYPAKKYTELLFENNWGLSVRIFLTENPKWLNSNGLLKIQVDG